MAKTRRTPVSLGAFEGEMPEVGTREGYWKTQFNTVLKPNPGRIERYFDVSESTASNLRKDYGLTCAAKMEDIPQADGSTKRGLVLYVQWVPENAERIKQDTLERGAKRRATLAAKAAENGGKAGSASKATAGTRS